MTQKETAKLVVECAGRDYSSFVSFDISKKLKLYDYVCTGIQGDFLSPNYLNYIGYVVQIRVSAGRFGSDLVILRHPDGRLMQHHNQGFFVLTKTNLKEAKTLFEDGVSPELEESEKGYDCGIPESRRVGFLIDDGVKIPVNSTQSVSITVKGGDQTITEIIL
jgi:hypothetical protein